MTFCHMASDSTTESIKSYLLVSTSVPSSSASSIVDKVVVIVGVKVVVIVVGRVHREVDVAINVT